MRFKKIVRMFEYANTSVSGLRGRGKDMLMANVIIRRKKPYISNVNYGGVHYPFEYEKLALNGNFYPNFISGKIKPYSYPYPDGVDLYISDAGIYFPSQYCSQLNRDYPQLPTYFALSRHLGLSNCHTNAQALGRVWDKIREQSDQYIVCLGCKVILGFVFQKIAIYERYESAVTVMPTLKLPKPIFEHKRERLARKTAEEMYRAQHGKIKFAVLIYRNKSKYDTRVFKTILEDKKHENQ